MKRNLKRLLCACLALAILTLTACSGNSGEQPAAAKGRYVETELSFPAEAGYITLLDQEENGDLILIANYTDQYSTGPYGLWRSTDGGATWQEEDAPFLGEFNIGTYLAGAARDAKGGYYLMYQQSDPEEVAAYLLGQDGEDDITQDPLAAEPPVAEVDPLDGEAGDSKEISSVFDEDTGNFYFDPASEEDTYVPEPYFMAYGDENGLSPLPYNATFETEYGMAPSGVSVLSNGDLVLDHYFRLTQIDSATGEIIRSYSPSMDGMLIGGLYLSFGDTLAMSEEEGIVLYDLRTGERQGSLSVNQADATDKVFVSTDDFRGIPIVYDEDEAAFYYTSNTGIYRSLVGGVTTEQLLDGELTSLNMPSLQLRQLIMRPDGSFLVYASENTNNILLHYHYDPDVASVPSTELKVYSLRDNQTIRQAMGMFQRQNPDVKVTYTIGMTGTDSITTSDAMRSLSNELLAGTGPDILVLDGMPVNSYIDNGVLLDLSGALDGSISSGTYLNNIAGAYRQNSALYAIPARFTVPMIHSSEDAAIAIHDLASMADWLESQENPVLPHISGISLFTQYYDLHVPVWFGEDGKLNGNAIAQSMEQINRISQAADPVYGFYDEEDEEDYLYSNLLFGSVLWGSDVISLNIAEISSISDAAGPDAANKKQGGGTLSILENGQGGVFVPRTVLGVNAASSQTDLALAFVQKTLSQEVLEYNFEDGLPINTGALQANMADPYSDRDNGMYYGVMFTTEIGTTVDAYLQILWPDAPWLEELVASISSIETASPVNLAVKEMILNEANGYFSSGRPLESVVSDMEQKINLYLDEQA